MTPIFFVLTIIVLGFICGQFLYRRLPEHSYQIQSIAVFIAMRIAIPLSVFLAIWQLNIQSWHLTWLPIIGTTFLLLGFVIGWLVSKCYRLPSLQHAVVAPAGSFTNLGAIGALVVFVYLGESGFALIPLFKLFEEVVYFAFLFPYAQSFSQLTELKKRRWWQDPILKTMFAVLFLGGLLNISDIGRPEWFESLTSLLVPIGTFSLMVSVGLVFRFKSVLQHWRVALTLALCKQLLLPIFVFCLVMIIGQANLYDGLFLKVAVLLAAMPMAFIVIMPATIYKLDQNLANACWIMSSIVFLVMLSFIPALLTWLS